MCRTWSTKMMMNTRTDITFKTPNQQTQLKLPHVPGIVLSTEL